ncbi:MAG: symmetrical bis(5'-nucleosyl)-tetraphosphatase [Burkholderiales bacterium]|nr:symmetrical bis(5'-nucleosyl)-tetraphosphatase [Burkholderiales bacterium]
MSRYAIGDLQGCFKSLQSLLAKIDFDRARDQLWLVGDLVNRGPGSLECLRFISGLGACATVVLGNHDLHLLAVAEGLAKVGKRDTIQPILAAPDREELLAWLRSQKLLHLDGNFLMVHAGLLPQWSLAQALELADEIEALLRGPRRQSFLKNMYGNEPNQWNDALTGKTRNRLVTTALTPMVFLAKNTTNETRFTRCSSPFQPESSGPRRGLTQGRRALRE